MAVGDVIARLSVQLNMDSASFEKGSAKAGKQADAIGDRMEAMGRKTGLAIKGIAAAGAAMAAGFIVNRLKDMVVASLDYASSLGEVATQLGVTTSALQQYRYMATQVGIEQDDMDKGLSFLTKSLGKMSVDSDAATKSLGKFGFTQQDVAKLSKMTAEQALPFLADKYAALTSVTEKSALAAEVFGSKLGPKMQTLLEGGSKGINDMANAYHKLGLEISPEMIARADDAADKLSAVKQVLDAKMAQAVAQNADKILALANAMIEGITAAANFYDAIVSFGDTKFAKALSAINDLINPFSRLADLIERANAGMNATASIAPKAAKAAASVPVDWSKAKGGIPPTLAKPGSAPLGSDWTRGGRGGAMMANVAGLGAIDFDAILRQINDPGMENGGGLFPSFNEVFADLSTEGEKATEALKMSFEDAATSVIGSISRMASAISGGGGFLDTLGSILDVGLQLASTFGAFSTPSSGGSSIPGYAGGTGFHPGGLAMVGERGPELVNMPRGSSVTPNNKLSGGGNTYHISGNLLTPEFWQTIQAGDVGAARAGSQLAQASLMRRQTRRLA